MAVFHSTAAQTIAPIAALERLEAAISQVRGQHEGNFERLERELHALFVTAERELLGEELERLDIDVPSVLVEGEVHHRVLRGTETSPWPTTWKMRPAPICCKSSLDVDNPVDWHPWGEGALSLAKKGNKPILLSIGYAACHWCHVMAHESFEDEETALLMNEHFINIKVDREERPDLDSIYMNAVTAMTGHGGWPMTVFLTAEGRPFYSGTYFPKEPRHGLPSFRQILPSSVWRMHGRTSRTGCRRAPSRLPSMSSKRPQ